MKEVDDGFRPFENKIGVMFKGVYQLTQAIEISEELLVFKAKGNEIVGQRAILNFNLPEIKPAIVTATVQKIENNVVVAKFEKSSFIIRKLLRHYVANS